MYSAEFKQFKTMMNQKRNSLKGNFAELPGADYIERALLEYPETLYELFRMRLEVEDWKYLDSKEGLYWFGRTFPVFALSKV